MTQTSSASVTTAGIAQLALANSGGTACGKNTLGGTSFYSSCTGNGGSPEYWCSDFARWVWANNGIDVSELSAAAGSFYEYGLNHGTLKNTPTVGDAVVFDSDGAGYADHVAIVTQVLSGGRIETASGDWNGDSGSEAEFSNTSHVIINDPPYSSTVGSQPSIMGMTISGFISPAGGATNNSPVSTGPACAGLDDGNYCGGDDVPGDPNTLYTCRNGAIASSGACANGCQINPGDEDDSCAAPECPGATGFTQGAIDTKYRALGGCTSILGVPTSNETGTPDGIGKYNVFQNGSIYWTEQTGAFEVNGSIRDEWSKVGWEAGILGYPVSDESATPDGIGKFSVFQNGSIYFSPANGAHEVHGAIRDKYASVGWEAGELGYPTSDEYAVATGRQNDFEHGSITYDTSTNVATVTVTP